MSFCRPLLSPVHIPKFPRHQFATRYTHAALNSAARAKGIRANVRLSRGVHSEDNSTKYTSPTADPSHIPNLSITNTVSKHENFREVLSRKAHQQSGTKEQSFDENLSTDAYPHDLSEADKNRDPKEAERAVAEILEKYDGGDAERDNMLRTKLSNEFSILSRPTLLRILQHLHTSSPNGLKFLTPTATGRLARRIWDSFNPLPTDRPFLRLLYPILLAQIEDFHGPQGLDVIKCRPPVIIYAAFAVVHKLLCLSFPRHALDLFQALVKANCIPSEAVQLNAASEDAKVIITSTLIRSSMYWNWRGLACAFLTELLTSPTSPKPIIDLNNEAIYELLDTPTVRDIHACGHLIRLVHKHTPVCDNTIQSFYVGAHTAGAKEDAERMYAFTRSPKVSDTHQYPPPRGVPLAWLITHLTTTSSRTHLARTLCSEIVDSNLPIPTTMRAGIIAAAAKKGYALTARALWERYATEADAGLVVGDSALMIRLVSLFWNTHTRSLKESWTGGPRAEEMRVRSEDAAKFAKRVMKAFKSHHAPLADAPHWALTSLARACFIVGRFPDGFEVFRFLLDRKELPDMYDVNVALSAVAQLNPRAAAKMVMEMKDLRADAVTYGTILHFAVQQGESNVVNSMVTLLQGLNDKRLSLKSLTNLIHATVSLLQSDSKEELGTKLPLILHLIDSFPDTNLASSVQTGKSLVYAALRAEDGELAYQFWKRLLHRSAQWDDDEQRVLRHRIGALLQRPGAVVKEVDKKKMLTQLHLKRVQG
ncbi:hypothetical protein H0H81_005492 [Sphagnurus paluster]|uniref:Uncharacterized protein n=1 Tax=Sphagnurus paluster TaxID=117069 RepID=A0A9P7GP68_9AGAR|nr:hypothetical protein H0H81_005492 [Sphagnurus paluster]